ncbi:MAG: DUF1800 domain-containing protein [Armatimonadetes bacterium]|nr:DUF1800 domain-containing protein [Armatimonadota bacterium]MDE2206083.1 DUF1800 domain-containing protein [Armatimonadota bacterium]
MSAEFAAPEARRSESPLMRGAAGVAVLAAGAAIALEATEAARTEWRGVQPPSANGWRLPPSSAAGAEAAHVLNRVAFGGRPGDTAAVAEMGPQGWIETQLAADLPDPGVVALRTAGLDVLQNAQDAPDALYGMSDDELVTETGRAALVRAIYGANQLREAMADFWTNHFNIYALKNDGRVLIPLDVERVIRPNALGRFDRLLAATAQSPAMLGYLDNALNRKGVPNENYARELLELHTVGVNSGYTQRDIYEVARCFTGWTLRGGWRRGEFVFNRAMHDSGAKASPFLGITIPAGGGIQDGRAVLAAAAHHPATAAHIASELCIRFLGTPQPVIVRAAAAAYLKSGTDIRATLRPILLDGLFMPDAAAPLLKRPLDYVTSALRATAADTDGGGPIQQGLASMGQPLYQWPMPDGFPEKASAWRSSLLPRWQFAIELCVGGIGGTRLDLNALARHATTPEATADALIGATLGVAPQSEPVASLRRALVAELASPGDEPDSLGRAAALLLASPQFQCR